MSSPISYVFNRHDIGILRQDGTTKVGLMLVKDKSGTPLFSLFDDEYLAQQYFSDTPGYGALPAEKELALRQDDWRAGFGLEYYDSNDTKRYYSSIGADLRFRGMGIAGPKSTAITVPSDTSITDAGMETWTDANNLTNWTKATTGTATLTQDSGTVHGGTYSAKWVVAVGGSGQHYQDITWNSLFQGKAVTFTCWVNNTNGTNAVNLQINDGVDTTTGSNNIGTGWEKLTVTKTLGAAATRLRIICNNLANTTSYWDDAVCTVYYDGAGSQLTMFPLTHGTVQAMAEFNSVLYFAFGKVLYKLNGTGNGFTLISSFPATTRITSMETFSSNLFLALGTADEYWYMSTAEAFTESTAVVKTFQYFKTVHSSSITFWGNDGGNTIRSTTNPINGGTAWSGQTTVGSSFYSITDLSTLSGALYIRKDDMPYYLNSAGAVQNDLAPELQTLTTTSQTNKIGVWLNKLYFPAGAQALLEYNDGVNSWRNPSDFCTNLSDFNGNVQAVAGDDRYLFAIVDNSTKIEVLAGRLETIDGSTGWVWHPINETTLTGCGHAFVSSIYQKRLWISSTLVTDSIYYIPLPTGYGNITSDANRSFQTTSYFITPWLHANFKSTVKAFPALELTMGHTYNAGRYITVAYEKLGDSSYTTIGNYTGSATSMTQSRFIPADASSNNPKSTMFRLKFTFVTDDTTITPVLLNYYLKGILYPDRRQIIACKVRCADEILLKDGTVDPSGADNIITVLDEARTATWPVTIYDTLGNTLNVKFLPLSGNIPRYTITKAEAGRKEQREYNLLMQIVAIS